MPAFSHSFLKRRMALSMDSFSRTLTPVINDITPNPAGSRFRVANSSSFQWQVKYFTVKMRSWRGKDVTLDAVIYHPACLDSPSANSRYQWQQHYRRERQNLLRLRTSTKRLRTFSEWRTLFARQKLSCAKVSSYITFQDNPRQSLGLLRKRTSRSRGHC